MMEEKGDFEQWFCLLPFVCIKDQQVLQEGGL